MSDPPRPRPRAFRLDDAKVRVGEDAAAMFDLWKTGATILAPQPDAFAPPVPSDEPANDEEAVEVAQKQGLLKRAFFTWGGLFWSALGGLVSLGIGLWATRVVEDLFSRTPALGWVGLALVALALASLFALALRELRAILRQRQIAELHIRCARARESDDRDAARAAIRDLSALYATRAETARARSLVAELSAEIVDGRDLLDIAERNLMTDLDAAARREVAIAAKRVSVVTAISPRALVDVAFVVAQAVRLIRRIAEIYGGRPGLLGFIKLARSVGAHLAITGGMAIGDSLIQQVVGHGIASRLSARLGEGVLNGMLTARIGLSALAVCRPMPFAAVKQPGVADVAPFLFGDQKSSS
jgi:putative membrane protein